MEKCYNKGCTYWNESDGNNCSYYHRINSCPFLYRDCSKKQQPLRPNNSYTFRGKINLEHLINDCIKDNKKAFIAIGDKHTYVGCGLIFPYMPLKAIEENIDHKGFYVIEIAVSDTGKAINFIKEIVEGMNKRECKVSRDIKKRKAKGEFSNQPETKVMVF